MKERTCGSLVNAIFHRGWYLLAAIYGCTQRQIRPNFEVWGLLYQPPSPIRAKFGLQVDVHGVHLNSKFTEISLYSCT